MRFQCLNCEHLFVYPAKTTATIPAQDLINDATQTNFAVVSQTSIENHVCPYCASKDIEEYTPEPTAPTVEEIGSVYIYELTSGPQTLLNDLLSQGYKIVNRYSKQYHLEKPKVAPKDAQPEQKPLEVLIGEAMAKVRKREGT